MQPLAAHLSAALGDPGPWSFARLSGGQSNPTTLATTPRGAYVVRQKPGGVLLPSAHAIDREYRVMAALGAAGFPVPRMLYYCADPGIIGVEFYVMAHVAGRVFFDTSLSDLTPAERTPVYTALIDRLADLHALDPAALGLADFGRAGGYLPRQTRRWSEQYRASETTPIPAMERLMDALPQAVAAIPDAACLVHGDYRLDNVMLHPERPEVVAVLDWELATIGHPLADLAYFLMTWTFPRGLRYGLGDTDLAAHNLPTMQALADRYAARAGRTPGNLDLLLAFSIFRIAAILQGVYARALQGNAAASDAHQKGADVARLADLAWGFGLRAGLDGAAAGR